MHGTLAVRRSVWLFGRVPACLPACVGLPRFPSLGSRVSVRFVMLLARRSLHAACIMLHAAPFRRLLPACCTARAAHRLFADRCNVAMLQLRGARPARAGVLWVLTWGTLGTHMGYSGYSHGCSCAVRDLPALADRWKGGLSAACRECLAQSGYAGADLGGVGPSPGADVAAVSRVPGRRCGLVAICRTCIRRRVQGLHHVPPAYC